MGSLARKIQELTGGDDEQQRIKERLELLLLAAKAKLRGYRDEINQQFLNPAQVDRIQIPGNRAIRFIEQYHVVAKQNMGSAVNGHLDRAIDAFFSIGGDKDTKKNVQSGVKNLIATGLSGFIGTTEAGESEERIYIVVPENNAFVRVDVAVWKYHMTQSKFIDESDTAIAYIFCKSVIDHTKITLDELIYMISDTLASPARSEDVSHEEQEVSLWIYNTNAQEWEEKADVKVRKTFVLDSKREHIRINPNGEDKPYNWQESLDVTHARQAPSINLVEAYIEELSKCWGKLKALDSRL
jgi:hypothetical protein